MKGSTIALWASGAVLVAWGVGGYNRLVRLRNEIGRQFALVEAQLRARDALLRAWLQVLRPSFGEAAQVLAAVDGIEGACTQLQAACDAARTHPSAARPMTSLRLADETLAQARARLEAELVAAAPSQGEKAVPLPPEEIAAIEATLAFTRGQFNAAIDDYNRAVDQFPTWLLALAFRFRSAGVF